MQRTCRITGTPFHTSAFEEDFCRRADVPLPTVHPRERMRRLCAFSNLTCLFHGTCAGSGEKMLHMYGPNPPFPVYGSPYWWSDAWDPMSFGRAYDFSRPFFPQLRELRDSVPHYALSVNYTTLENCDYVCGASYCKNCYLCFSSAWNEDCLFCENIWRSRDCIDCNSVYDCELCFDCTAIDNCYQLRHSFNCKNCGHAAFLWNCLGCNDCFGCCNLRQKRFCFFNEQLSEADYRQKIGEIEWDNRHDFECMREQFLAFAREHPQPAVRGVEFSDSTGDFLSHCQNAQYCFDCHTLEDCSNCLAIEKSKDCVDFYSWGSNAERIYHSSRCGYDIHNLKFCWTVYLNSSDVEYSLLCVSCKNCFACVGLRNREYCILNCQYDKHQYLELKNRIIAQMRSDQYAGTENAYGEFYPYWFSPLYCNHSDAAFYFPFEERDAQQRQARWLPTESREVTASKQIDEVPVRTRDVSNDIARETFVCPRSGQPYRITGSELESYKRRSLPLPTTHWKTRLLTRRALLHRPELYTRHCAKTGKEILTSFPPDSPSRVWDYAAYVEEFGG
jgi:hypothetical protein